MIQEPGHLPVPAEFEAEKASNSYIMSLLAITGGLPLPVINLFATLIFFLGNRKATYFVRWHCLQALLSQFSLLIVNSIATVWTILIIFGSQEISSNFISYVITILIYNLVEFIATIDAAVKTRKGIHIEWWFYGSLTNLLCRKES
jgi:uncharacterized Tic20 family protein